jgi:hypothetical protein
VRCRHVYTAVTCALPSRGTCTRAGTPTRQKR